MQWNVEDYEGDCVANGRTISEYRNSIVRLIRVNATMHIDPRMNWIVFLISMQI
jgi:hypothetical protein